MKKIFVGLILMLIPLVAVVPFTDGEMAKDLTWVDHEPNPRFAIYDSGTPTFEMDDLVLDKEKGLIWTRNAYLAGEPLTWKSATIYCQYLTLCNLKGWRLPTKEEFSNLIDPSQSVPALPKGHPFVNLKYTYWTSTTHENYNDDAYYVHLSEGTVRAYTKHAKYEVWSVMGR